MGMVLTTTDSSGTETSMLRFSYDANGKVVAVNYNGTYYYYLRNAQGDIVKLIDKTGTAVVEYTYDTWGKLLRTTGSLSETFGKEQPFRYRGYVYDEETSWYYLQSRYYNPEIGKFISADVYLSTGQGVLGHNAYAYCNNEPINLVDDEGNIPKSAKQFFDPIEEGASGYVPYRPIGASNTSTAGQMAGGGGIADEYTRTSITKIYRSVGEAEAQDIKITGQFNLALGGMECKQFGFNLAETKQFGNMMSQYIIVSAEIPTNMLNQFFTGGVDTTIFRSGTLTVYGEQLVFFNQAIRGTIQFIP